MSKKHVDFNFFFFKFLACAVPTDKCHGRQMPNGCKACSPYESGSSRRLIYMHYHDCVYSKNQFGFSKIIIIRLGYQPEIHKSRSQRRAAPSPPIKKKKKKKKRKKEKRKKTSIPKPWRHIYRALLSMNYIPTNIPQPPGLHWDFHCALGGEHMNAPGKSCTQFVINRFVAVYTH